MSEQEQQEEVLIGKEEDVQDLSKEDLDAYIYIADQTSEVVGDIITQLEILQVVSFEEYCRICFGRGLSKAYELLRNHDPNAYAIMPALGVSERVAPDTDDVYQVIRQGVLIRTVEGNYYYIGGISERWRAGNFYVSQAGSLASTKIYSDTLKWYKENNVKVGVIPLYKEKDIENFINPPLLYWCSQNGQPADIPIGLDELLNSKTTVAGLLSTLQWVIIGYAGDPFIKRHGQLQLESLFYRHELVGLSSKPPTLLAGMVSSLNNITCYAKANNIANINQLLSNPRIKGIMILPYNTYADMAWLCRQKIPNKGICKWYEDNMNNNKYISLNETSIGAPIFSNVNCCDSCEGLVLLGFVGEIIKYDNPNGNTSGIIGVYPSPKCSKYTDACINDYVSLLGINEPFNIQLTAVNNAKKAKNKLIYLGFPAQIAETAVEYVENWLQHPDKIAEEAKPYAEKANNVAKKIWETIQKDKLYRCLNYDWIYKCLDEYDWNESEEDLYKKTLNCVMEMCYESGRE
ncbi:hypothetical protein SJAV_11470 [Sulfurisphaera javensis]|uniref:Uncharacterized protein n=1 Tax=Sulfurisphaera javensis TaxID=2049879 RepID=A0AAT9GQQ5_9CREN